MNRSSFIIFIILIVTLTVACERKVPSPGIPSTSSYISEQSSSDTRESEATQPPPTSTIENTRTVEPTPTVLVPSSQLIIDINGDITVMDPYSPEEVDFIYFPSLEDLPNSEPRAVSPDEEKIIIRSVDARIGKFRLFVLDLKSGKIYKLIYDNASQGIARWSPNSEDIAFVLFYENESRIVIVNYQNNSIIEIHGAHRWDSIPTWSPDGEKVYFLSSADLSDITHTPSPNQDIFEFNIASRELRKLTDETIFITDFSLSPDGSKFIFSSFGQVGDLFTFDVNNGDIINLTNSSSSERSPIWSPDGDMITFSSDRDNNWEIYLMNVNGSSVKRITFDREVDTPIMWSPNGDYFTFVSKQTGTWQLYIYIISSGEIMQITYDVWYPYLADITTTIAP